MKTDGDEITIMTARDASTDPEDLLEEKPDYDEEPNSALYPSTFVARPPISG